MVEINIKNMRRKIINFKKFDQKLPCDEIDELIISQLLPLTIPDKAIDKIHDIEGMGLAI